MRQLGDLPGRARQPQALPRAARGAREQPPFAVRPGGVLTGQARCVCGALRCRASVSVSAHVAVTL